MANTGEEKLSISFKLFEKCEVLPGGLNKTAIPLILGFQSPPSHHPPKSILVIVGAHGVEPCTLVLSGLRSNQMS